MQMKHKKWKWSTYDYNYKGIVVSLILPYIAPCGAYKEVWLQSQGTPANWSIHEFLNPIL